MKKLILGAPALLLVCTGCTQNPKLQPDHSSAMRAKVMEVSATMSAGTAGFTGVIVARQVADISSQVLAPIVELRVHEGDKVRKGEVLVRLSSASLQAAVQQSQSQVVAAKKQGEAAEAQKNLAAETYARYTILNQRHSVTPHEYDQVKAQLDAANAQVQAASAQVAAAEAGTRQSEATNAYTIIRAPFSGVVTRKYVDAGAIASPGSPLLQIEDASEHEVDIQVNESSLHNFHVAEQVKVQVNGAATPIIASVKQIVPGGDPAAHTFTVKIGLPSSPSVYSGMTANVLVPTGERPSIVVPKSSIRQRGQLDSVVALDSNSVAQIRYVTLGQQQGDAVEIISGIAAHDRILAQPDDSLIGHRIEPQP